MSDTYDRIGYGAACRDAVAPSHVDDLIQSRDPPSQENPRRFNWREFGLENVLSTAEGFIGGVVFGAASKYFCGKIVADPITYGLMITPFGDFVEAGVRSIVKRKKTPMQLIQDDPGTFAGQSLGCYVGYNLASFFS